MSNTLSNIQLRAVGIFFFSFRLDVVEAVVGVSEAVAEASIDVLWTGWDRRYASSEKLGIACRRRHRDPGEVGRSQDEDLPVVWGAERKNVVSWTRR